MLSRHTLPGLKAGTPNRGCYFGIDPNKRGCVFITFLQRKYRRSHKHKSDASNFIKHASLAGDLNKEPALNYRFTIVLLITFFLSGCFIKTGSLLDEKTRSYSDKEIGFSISLSEEWDLSPKKNALFKATQASKGLPFITLTAVVEKEIPFLKHYLRINGLKKFPSQMFKFSQGKLSNIKHLSNKKRHFGEKALAETVWAAKRDGIAKVIHTINLPLERAIVQLNFELSAALYKKPDTAIQSVLKGIVILPTPNPSPKALSLTYKNIGQAYQRAQLWKEASIVLEQAVTEQPDDPDLYMLLGQSYTQLKFYDNALNAFIKTTELSFQNAKAHKSLGETYLIQKKFDQGVFEIKLAITITDDDAPLYLILGNAYLRQGKPEEAIRSFQKLLRKKELETEGHLGIGKAYLATELYDQAIFEFKEVLRDKPQHKEPHCLLAKAYTKIKSLDEASKERALC